MTGDLEDRGSNLEPLVKPLNGAAGQNSEGAWGSGLRPVTLLNHGQPIKAAQLVPCPRARPVSLTTEADVYRPMLSDITARGFALAYGLGGTAEFCRCLERLDFKEEFSLVCRRRYLAVNAVKGHVPFARFGLRRFARASRQLRDKLLEMELESEGFRLAANVFSLEKQGLSLACDRTEASLAAQFENQKETHGLLVFRRNAGQSINAYLIFDERVDAKGRRILRLLDYWTTPSRRRAMIWLFGELSVWALAMDFDILEAFSVKGSSAEQAFIASGGLRKKEVYPV